MIPIILIEKSKYSKYTQTIQGETGLTIEHCELCVGERNHASWVNTSICEVLEVVLIMNYHSP